MIKATSRDNARTPMQWNAEEGAGFTHGKPWLKIHPNYKEVNVEADLKNPDGVIAFFKKINAFKKSSETLKNGSFSEIYAGKRVYAFARELEGERLIAVCNFSTKTSKLPEEIFGEIIISNYNGCDNASALRPYEYRLYKEVR